MINKEEMNHLSKPNLNLAMEGHGSTGFMYQFNKPTNQSESVQGYEQMLCVQIVQNLHSV
jgi:hypothetical protein